MSIFLVRLAQNRWTEKARWVQPDHSPLAVGGLFCSAFLLLRPHDRSPTTDLRQVKLKLVWSQLIVPLIPRLRTGEVDIEQTPSPHLSDEAKDAWVAARGTERRVWA